MRIPGRTVDHSLVELLVRLAQQTVVLVLAGLRFCGRFRRVHARNKKKPESGIQVHRVLFKLLLQNFQFFRAAASCLTTLPPCGIFGPPRSCQSCHSCGIFPPRELSREISREVSREVSKAAHLWSMSRENPNLKFQRQRNCNGTEYEPQNHEYPILRGGQPLRGRAPGGQEVKRALLRGDQRSPRHRLQKPHFPGRQGGRCHLAEFSARREVARVATLRNFRLRFPREISASFPPLVDVAGKFKFKFQRQRNCNCNLQRNGIRTTKP